MRYLTCLINIVAFNAIVFFAFSSAARAENLSVREISEAAKASNSIYGQIWDPYNRPVSDINVELLNELYMTVARQKTNGSGRFEFHNLPAGSFKVKVLTIGTNYQEQVQDAQIVNLVKGASDQQYLEFHLKFDPRKINVQGAGASEAVFSQEVPAEARSYYKKGAARIAEKNDQGFSDIEKSLQIFPNYYDALNFLGTEYVKRKEYEKALPYLIKAIDINQRSFSSFYALGYACYKLDQRPEAAEAARAATIIKPASVDAQLLYGTVLRIGGIYERAEKALLQAKKLSEEKPVPEIFWQLALLYNKLGRNQEAADQLETYLKIQPDSSNRKEIKELIAKLRAEST